MYEDKKAVRKNYLFGLETDYYLRQLAKLTGKCETQVVEAAIEQYFEARFCAQEVLPGFGLSVQKEG